MHHFELKNISYVTLLKVCLKTNFFFEEFKAFPVYYIKFTVMYTYFGANTINLCQSQNV